MKHTRQASVSKCNVQLYWNTQALQQVIESIELLMSEKTQSNIELMNISKLLTALLLHTVDEAILGIEGFHLATTTDAKF